MAAVTPPWSTVEALVRSLVLPYVGGLRLRRAVERTGSVEAAANDLAGRARRRMTPTELDRAAGWARAALRTIREQRIHVLVRGREGYPHDLERLAVADGLEDPPFVLFARGRLSLLRTPLVAIVGTRTCSEYGLRVAGRIAGAVAAAGATVLSGLARGIDGAAHRAAGPSRTVGVLGCGIDVIYPLQNRRLQESIASEGLLLSEQVPGMPPTKGAFPRRNRLIAALAAGVVVVEAPHKSGALITARQAIQLSRSVFVVPGEVGRKAAAGGNALIRDGGTLVTSAAEVLEELGLPLPPAGVEEDAPPAGLYGVGLALWRSLGTEPRHADDVAAAVGLDPHQGLASLLSLEVTGHARQLAGLRFVRA